MSQIQSDIKESSNDSNSNEIKLDTTNDSKLNEVKSINVKIQLTLPAYMAAAKGHDNFQKQRQSLYKSGIKTTYDDSRVIFSTKNKYNNFMNSSYVRESSGLILEMNTWRPLVVPPPTINYYTNKEKVNQYLAQNQYTIYEAKDGSRINLYYYNGAWVMSTNNGLYMNQVKWNLGKTYQEIVCECLSKTKLIESDVWASFTALLNVNSSYTFGFKHPDMHPFYEGKETPVYDFWFVQEVNLDEKSESYMTVSNQWTKDVKIPMQKEIVAANLTSLFNNSKQSLDNFIHNDKVCYGYILRSNKDLKEHNHIFIESSLMKKIRNLQYENELIDYCNKNKFNKEHFLVLNAYLDREIFSLYKTLFKHQSKTFDKYATLFDRIINCMCSLSDKAEYKDDQPGLEIITQIAQGIYNKFTHHVKLNISSYKGDVKKQIFSDYILHNSNRILCEDLMKLM
jgi:hypothetical protein